MELCGCTVGAINGFPLGGIVLNQAILADVIDYDEFLHYTRQEGCFTVFGTFIPKVVSVPAAVLPLSIICTSPWVLVSQCLESCSAPIQGHEFGLVVQLPLDSGQAPSAVTILAFHR